MSISEEHEDLFPLAEVAKAAKVHPRTLERWAEAGKIPKPRRMKANNRRVYSAQDRATIINFARATEPG